MPDIPEYNLPVDYEKLKGDRDTPMTDEQLRVAVATATIHLKRAGMLKRGELVEDVMTCVNCKISRVCRSAFDTYNTDGDCLEDK